MRILLVVGLMFFTLYTTAQTNPSNISEKVLKGETFGLSLSTINGIIKFDGSGELIGTDNPDRNSFDLTITPKELGTFTYVIKYEENGQFFYTTIVLEVVESIIDPVHDYSEVTQNQVAILDVLSNDYSSDGELELTSIPYVQNGTARIVDALVEFSPDSDFTGLAYINYVVTDSKGLSETGFATVHVISEETSLMKDYFLQVGESLDIVVPSEVTLENFSKTSLGKLNQTQFGAISYNAGKKAGIEVISYRTPTRAVGLNIHVLPKEEKSDFIRDDLFFTSAGSPIQFDVFANDLEDIYPIVSKSPELKNIAPNSGKFSYTPPAGFQGVQNFFYEVSDGSNIYLGNIEIIVDNFLPEVREYDFVTRVNTPFVLQYALPLEGGVFNFMQAPVNGTLRLDPNGFHYGCGSVLGQDFLVYTPNDGFVGQDEFEIEFCAADGSCVQLEVIMAVVSSSNDCNCIGLDCAWPGDADGDGRVSIKDLLPIGYYMGEKGPSRKESGNIWNAVHADDWGENNIETGQDIKNADSNGDGTIDINDVQALDDNYARLNSFVTREALSIKNVPFYAVPSKFTGSSGDLILIHLYIGTADHPLLESNGLAFNFNIPGNYIEENSLRFSFAPQAWYGYNNPTIDFVQYPTNGRVEASISRTGRSSVDGHGLIGTFEIVLQEDIDGVKPESNTIPIDIKIDGGQFFSEEGSKYGLEDSELTIYLDLNDQNVERVIDIVTYPNPASDRLTFHANNQDEIKNIVVHNILGERINTYPNIQSNHFEMDTRHLPQGFYLATVKTEFGVSTEKVQVIRE